MSFTIGQLANEADINVETIRYYERRGLIVRPDKPGVGYRQYSAEILEKLRFIKRAKTLGFKLDEVRNLLILSDGHCADVQSLAQHKLSHIKTKLKDLHRLEDSLEDLVKQCSNSVDKAHCPIIENLLSDK